MALRPRLESSGQEWLGARVLRYLLGSSALAMTGYGSWMFFRGGFGWLETVLLLPLVAGFVGSVMALYFSRPWNAEAFPDDPRSLVSARYRRVMLLSTVAATGLTLLEPTFFHLAFWLAGQALALYRSLRWAWLYLVLAFALIGYGQGHLDWPLQADRVLVLGLEAAQFIVLTGLLFLFLREALRRENGVKRPLPISGEIEPLSPRELEVLRLLADGMSNKHIAKTLGLSEGTIKNYVSVILTKLEVKNRTQAANAARSRGLI